MLTLAVLAAFVVAPALAAEVPVAPTSCFQPDIVASTTIPGPDLGGSVWCCCAACGGDCSMQNPCVQECMADGDTVHRCPPLVAGS